MNLRCGELSGLEFAVAADETNPRKIFCLKMLLGLKIKGVPAAGLGSGSSTGSGRDALAPTRHQGTKGAPPGVWWSAGHRPPGIRAGTRLIPADSRRTAQVIGLQPEAG